MLHFTTDVEMAGEFGWILDGDLDEDHVVGIGQVVVAADLAKFVVVIDPITAVGFMRYEPDGPPGGEGPGLVLVLGSQFLVLSSNLDDDNSKLKIQIS